MLPTTAIRMSISFEGGELPSWLQEITRQLEDNYRRREAPLEAIVAACM